LSPSWPARPNACTESRRRPTTSTLIDKSRSPDSRPDSPYYYIWQDINAFTLPSPVSLLVSLHWTACVPDPSAGSTTPVSHPPIITNWPKSFGPACQSESCCRIADCHASHCRHEQSSTISNITLRANNSAIPVCNCVFQLCSDTRSALKHAYAILLDLPSMVFSRCLGIMLVNWAGKVRSRSVARPCLLHPIFHMGPREVKQPLKKRLPCRVSGIGTHPERLRGRSARAARNVRSNYVRIRYSVDIYKSNLFGRVEERPRLFLLASRERVKMASVQ